MTNQPYLPPPVQHGQPQASPPKPPWPVVVGTYAVALGELVKAMCVFLWWITIGAASLGGCFIALRAIWAVLSRVLEALGVPLYESR